jgi:hypothetical protein
MTNGADVMEMLIPTGGWIMVGNDYEGITFLECEPITKAQFEAGFAQYDAWKAEQDAALAADKANATSKLEALGLTADDLKALGL